MLIVLEQILTPDQVHQALAQLRAADWVDGKGTAGEQSGQVKHNRQLPENSPLAQQLGQIILQALGHHQGFLAAAIPDAIFPPLFNRYGPGEGFGLHVDNAIRPLKGTGRALRTDLSATLFFTDPASYEGGVLEIETTYGAQSVKLQAGDLVLYPSTSLHRVTQVTAGERICAFFWLQSMVRDQGQRELLYDLDQSIQQLAAELTLGHPEVVRLTGVYHNLMRRWASCS